MQNQRPPSDDLQKGEVDPHTIVPESIIEHHLSVAQMSAPPTFKVWWVDTEDKDHRQKISADTEAAARSAIYAMANCKYIVSCSKIEYR